MQPYTFLTIPRAKTGTMVPNLYLLLMLLILRQSQSFSSLMRRSIGQTRILAMRNLGDAEASDALSATRPVKVDGL